MVTYFAVNVRWQLIAFLNFSLGFVVVDWIRDFY